MNTPKPQHRNNKTVKSARTPKGFIFRGENGRTLNAVHTEASAMTIARMIVADNNVTR